MKIMQALINKRFDFVYGDAHGVAHVLDPRFCGAQMDTETQSSVEKFITEWRGINKEQGEATADAVVIELVRFQRFTAELKVKAQRMWTQLKNGKLAVYDFWCPLKQFSLLQDIAKQVFPCTAGSSAAERNFSAHGFTIHSYATILLQNELKNMFTSTSTFATFKMKILKCTQSWMTFCA
ncbi:hypothetical protein F442_14751 [Phytophthora nicotianae P10297]|uniref:HAT C-terminal dimerisation domain-containing protein n=1 Tax=Phytophthora nicotianae P10297 TaxID=1317064 RepID=W2YU32_PHYNI|nr:hypothetical protein F442_14751 [Phytophthora nicotianae P10297]